MSIPTFGLAEDGRHFWWQHDCDYRMEEVTPDIADWYRGKAGAPHELPLGPDKWQLVQADPLTVTPSIHCLRCGTHGFITDGKWVPA